jgi:protein-S-isoprenylcysteine O-methyltransferase Ste14
MEFPILDYSPWIIAAAAAVYGIVHSLMASIGFKDLLNTFIGKPVERYYRLFYSIFSVITLLPVLVLAALIPDVTLYRIPQPWSLLTLGIQVTALGLLSFSLLQTGVFQFVGLSQALGLENKDELNMRGLYRYLRHPLYTFSLVFLWLTPTMTRNMLILYAALTVYFIIGALVEERKLERTFGEDYRKYKSRTPFLIPFIF